MNQGIQFPLADSLARLDAAELVLRKATWLYDQGKPCAREANTAKYLCADAGFDAADRALQTHGGMGYSEEYHVARYFREARLLRIAPLSQEMVLNYLGRARARPAEELLMVRRVLARGPLGPRHRRGRRHRRRRRHGVRRAPGAAVLVTDLDKDAAAAVAAEIIGPAARAESAALDVRDADAGGAGRASRRPTWPAAPCTSLVNNAGAIAPAMFAKMTPESVRPRARRPPRRHLHRQPGGAAVPARRRHRPDHQRHLGRRPGRHDRPGQLRRGEGRDHRPHQVARQGAGPQARSRSTPSRRWPPPR